MRPPARSRVLHVHEGRASNIGVAHAVRGTVSIAAVADEAERGAGARREPAVGQAAPLVGVRPRTVGLPEITYVGPTAEGSGHLGS